MPRLPRFQRATVPPPLALTTRDVEILRQVARHRFLNSAQIIALLDGSPQHILRRLQRLFHHGHLDRPHAQLRYFSEDGSQPLVYALGRAGARVLADPARKHPRHDNRNVKQLYMQHTLLVADVLIAFVRAQRVPGAPRLLWEEDLIPDQSPSVAFRWAATVRYQGATKRVGVVPDRAFALESKSTGERITYFVEADRATMPVTRRSLSQSSMLRKLLAYEATWTQGLHRERFGCERFRVLVVTSSPERANHLAELCAELPRGRGLFLFTDADALRGQVISYAHNNIFELPWLTAGRGTERIGASFALKNAA